MPASSVSSDGKTHCMASWDKPTLALTLASMQSVIHHNEGVDLANLGQFGAAEQHYLKALALKNKFMGKDAISTALTHNTLGQLYIATDRLDEAEKHLKIAVEIRNADEKGPTFDAAFSREYLAVVYEMRGDLVAAKQMRKSTGKFACGNHHDGHCPGRVFNKSGLRQCAKCTAIFYCTPVCQKADWGRHKKYCHKLESDSSS